VAILLRLLRYARNDKLNIFMKIKFPLVVVGSQWGDEGKGKVVDLLAEQADEVVRFNGGNNAGHSVVLNGKKYKLSLLPAGILQKKNLYLSQAVVINPRVLLEEIALFKKEKLPLKIHIDPRCNIVMPYHQELDAATEKWKGKKATGSLHLGIGYCYEDRNNRFGIRFEDLINPQLLKEKLEMFFPLKKLQIEKVFGQKSNLNIGQIYNEYVAYGKKLKPYLADVSTLIQEKISQKKVLFEGAHGTFLDGNFGTYPYTTAVNTISGAVFTAVGIAPQKIYSLGIVKAYTTRVGNGNFPTELFDKIGEGIREKGGEYGTVSKRPRRCGWLDLCLLRSASRWSGFDYLAITKLDVLSGLKKIKVCTHYILKGKKIKSVPALINDFTKCKPVYKEFSGWSEDISQIRDFKKLPQTAQIYLKYIAQELQVPLKIISVSPERTANIFI